MQSYPDELVDAVEVFDLRFGEFKLELAIGWATRSTTAIEIAKPYQSQ